MFGEEYGQIDIHTDDRIDRVIDKCVALIQERLPRFYINERKFKYMLKVGGIILDEYNNVSDYDDVIGEDTRLDLYINER
jgi:hypothetical protein